MQKAREAALFGGVLSIRRIRGWVGGEPIQPQASAWGYPEPLLRSSIRMACRGLLAGLPTPTAASQLSPDPRHCKGEFACLFGMKHPIVNKGEPRMNTNRHEYGWTFLAASTSRDGAPWERGRVLLPLPLRLKGANAGLPGCSPAGAAEPSRFVCLRGPSCDFVDHSFFVFFKYARRPQIRVTSTPFHDPIYSPAMAAA